MVISLATSDCHSAAEALTSSTAPVDIDARNVMMATTASSARPAIEPRGTIGDRLRAFADTRGRSCPRSTNRPRSSPGLFIDMQPSMMQHHPPRLILIHQRDVVGCDNHRGAGLVQLDEQPQQSPPQGRIDVAGRLIRQQQQRPRDHGARDRRALLLAPGQHRRQGIHSLAKPDPFQQIDHLLAIARFLAPHHPERQRHVFIGSHMIEQAEVLQHDTYSLAQVGNFIFAEHRDVVAEQIDQAAGRPQRQEQQPQQRGLAGAGRPGEELEGMGGDQETEVAQNLRAKPVTQSDIFEPNQAQLRSTWGADREPEARSPPVPRRPRTRQNSCASVMVSDSLTVALYHSGSVIVEIGSMHIICPHCTTSYAIDLATLGASGRTVRCSRCKEVWLARPEDATEIGASMPAMAEAGGQTSAADAAAEWDALAREDDGQEQGIPVVDSPSISGDWPASADGQRSPQSSETDWPSIAHNGPDAESARPQRLSLLQRL